MNLKEKSEKVRQYLPWLYWWLFFALLCLGFAAINLGGILRDIFLSDFTRISFLIMTLFLFFTIRIGKQLHHFCRQEKISKKYADEIRRKNQTGWFASENFLTLGMLGTVIGFIYLFAKSFSNVDPGNVASLQQAISHISVGMGTALYTTAVGLVCRLFLAIQLFGFDYCLKKKLMLPAREDNDGKKDDARE